MLRGNHDHWLANYIFHYYGSNERDRALLQPYPYNSFHLLQERLTEVDLKELAEYILSWPVQVEIEVDGQPYLLAHACTAEPGKWKLDNYYLMGDLWYKVFLHEGVHGYISVCGHQNMGNGSIWKNKKETSICVTAAAASRMEDWDAFAWKRKKLSMYKQTEEKQ